MSDSKACVQCGATYDPSDWYPTVAVQVEDGIEIYSFCSTNCQAAWERTGGSE